MAEDTTPKSKTTGPNGPPTASLTSARPTPAAPKPLTAKKSTSQPAGNIFTSGEMRKQRSSLKDAMSDPTREAKLFDRHRHRRRLQLLSRDKEDIAPDPSNIQLFSLTRGPTAAVRRSSAISLVSPTQRTPDQETTTPIQPKQPSALASSDAVPPKKKRKSVRFLEVDDGSPGLVEEPEQMDVDVHPSQGRQRLRSPPAQRTQSLDQFGTESSAWDLIEEDKTLVVGQSTIKVTFHGSSQASSSRHPWHVDFVAKSTLEFRHACHAKTAGSKIASLIQRPLLASGTLAPRDDGPAVEHVAEYLTTGMLALYCEQTGYNVLVYPTKCEEWRSIRLAEEPVGSSEAMLSWLLFTSPPDCTHLLPPLTLLDGSRLASGEPKSKTDDEAAVLVRPLVMKRLFEFDYDKLLPAKRPLPEHNFFLAIPESRGAIGQALFRWLRANNPKCHIFTNHRAGGWKAFRERVDRIPGAIIIHEMLAWSLRRIPDLAKHLLTRNDEYWYFSEPAHRMPLYPSISIPENDVAPGDMRLARLFPYRTAIFVTPSFLVSEPRRTLDLFRWFTTNRAGSFHFRLVTAHNIHEYMAELANERYHARQRLWTEQDDVQPEIHANLSGLSREDCRCRYEAAEMAAGLDMTRMATAGPYAHDDDSSSLVYADPSIDPNDEQSLVNWFGWWSTVRADQFRKFHVIGSDDTTNLYGSRKGERLVQIPTYSEVTINEPDAVPEVVQGENDLEDAAEAETRGETSPQPPTHEMEQTSLVQGPWAFRSNLVLRENKSHLSGWLKDLINLNGFKLQWMLYTIPVCWLDLQMADHFGDPHSKGWPRIQDWFEFTYAFGRGPGKNKYYSSGDRFSTAPPGYNTYVGFFYTIADKEWDPDNLPENQQRPQRHPWIAIYRPVNPHIRPFGRCEVIIWDPAVRERYPRGRAPAEKDLIFMQRQLIQHVREQTPIKNTGTWLDQVWLGGWDWPAECNSPYPIDVTLQFLRCMLSDIRDYLPAPEHVMESKGFKRLALGATSSPSPPTFTNRITRSPTADSDLFVDQDGESEPMDIDPPSSPRLGGHNHNHNPRSAHSPAHSTSSLFLLGGEREAENVRVIFHPPRGTTTTTTTSTALSSSSTSMRLRSRCINRLYEEARLVRARDPDAEYMPFRYPPTMEWYREQREEGRGYAHVNVDSWEGVFALLKIPRGGGGLGEKQRRAEGGGGGGGGGGQG